MFNFEDVKKSLGLQEASNSEKWGNHFIQFIAEHSQDEKDSINEKLLLFKQSMKTGDVFFLSENAPMLKLPEWYADTVFKKLSKDEREKKQDLIEKRKAYFYLVNEHQELQGKGK